MNATNDRCPLCGGRKTSATTTFSADLGTGVVVVRRVRASVCEQCGEEWIDDATARQLERVVDAARSRQAQVEVTVFA